MRTRQPPRQPSRQTARQPPRQRQPLGPPPPLSPNPGNRYDPLQSYLVITPFLVC
jgi:transposase